MPLPLSLLYNALPAKATSTSTSTHQQTRQGGQQIKPGRGASPAVHLRDIVSPYSTGWGSTAVPEVCCGGWVASTTRQFLTGSTRPSEKKQSERLPSTEFPDPSHLSSVVPCGAAPPGGVKGGVEWNYTTNYGTISPSNPNCGPGV